MKRFSLQERNTAQRLQGQVTPQSGAGWVRKNDVRTLTESVECKTTSSDGYRLTWKTLKKASDTALLDGRRMVFEIEFQGHGRYVVLNADDYEELRDKDVA